MPPKKSDSELPIESVVAFSPCSNGEYMPLPPTERAQRAEQRWREIVEVQHKRLGISRRVFARGACGIAASLLALEQVACGSSGSGGDGSGGGSGSSSGGSSGGAGTSGATTGGSTSDADSSGGFYDVPNDTTGEPACAEELLYDPDEFVFDVQTHTATPFREGWGDADPPEIALDYLKQIFVDGGTTVACITGIPAARDPGQGNLRAIEQLQEILATIGGDRLRLHCNVDMNLPGEVDYMQMCAETFAVNAWKVYPYAQPWLANEAQGAPFIAKARALGIKVIAAHRGLTTTDGDYLHAGSPRDLVEAASQNPDITFLNYHSGWEPGNNENHPYDPGAAPEDVRGIDRLIRAILEFGIAPNTGNVYAELGSTWFNLLVDPAQAAHALGKLLLYVGEDRVIYGTDSVFNGSPEGQIAALRTFQIPARMRETYGYPEITTEMRRKILGLNAAPIYDVDPMTVLCRFGLDEIEQLKMAYRYDPRAVDMPHPHKYLGPRNRREFFAFERAAHRDLHRA